MNAPSWRLDWQSWLALLGLGLTLWLAITYSDVLLEMLAILFGAFLLSLAIRPLADILARRRVPRGLTVLGVYLGLLGLLISLGALLLPIISTEISRLQTNGPELLQTALSRFSAIPGVEYLMPSLESLGPNLVQSLSTLFPTLLNTVTGAGELTVNLLVMLILAYFFAADATIGPSLLQMFIPVVHRPRLATLMSRLQWRLTRWIWAQAAMAVYFAVSFGLGLAWLGVPFAPTIALIGGVLEIIPYVGGATALFLALVSALTVNPWLIAWVLGFYVIVAQVQSHLVAPAVYGRAVHLHPAAILVALLIGLRAGGIVGVFFAVPIAVVLITLLQEWQAASAVLSRETPADKVASIEEIVPGCIYPQESSSRR
jgi:predicted PurR-regulated permease PerM